MMPISAIGNGAASAKDSGFTLVELLVVLVLFGLLTSAVLLSGPGAGDALRADASKFAFALTAARDEAVFGNRVVEVRVTPRGYSLAARSGAARRPLSAKSFAPGSWTEGVSARVLENEAESRIAFDPTGSATPAVIELVHDTAHLRITVDASGNIATDAAR